MPKAAASEPVAWNCVYEKYGHFTLKKHEADHAAANGATVTALYASAPVGREEIIEECAKVAASCNVRYYPHNSSGLLQHQIDCARDNIVAAIRALKLDSGENVET